ncbi:hypothetical protein [Halospeciosus flavus]|uniref:hypothetical protein n=1 Tax=Halospeciosus flavus TaxID=3032283 RepID=UPI00361F6320
MEGRSHSRAFAPQDRPVPVERPHGLPLEAKSVDSPSTRAETRNCAETFRVQTVVPSGVRSARRFDPPTAISGVLSPTTSSTRRSETTTVPML